MRVGEPFNPSAVRQDVAALTAYYWNHGWREASVQDRYTLSEDRTKAYVVYRVDEGMRSFFGKTIVRGNAITDPDRILRQVAWKEGEPYSEEKIADTQQNLARTGVFRIDRGAPAAGRSGQPVAHHRRHADRGAARLAPVRLRLPERQRAPSKTATTSSTSSASRTAISSAGCSRPRSKSSTRPLAARPLLREPRRARTSSTSSVPLTLAVFVSREPIQDIDIDASAAILESVRHSAVVPARGPALLLPADRAHEPAGPLDDRPREVPQVRLPDQAVGDRPELSLRPARRRSRSAERLLRDPGRQVRVSLPARRRALRQGLRAGAWFKSIFGGVLGASVRVGGISPTTSPREIPVPIAGAVLRGRLDDGARLRHRPPGHTPRHRGLQHAGHVDTPTRSHWAPARRRTASPTSRHTTATPARASSAATASWRGRSSTGYPIFGNLGVSIFYDLAQVWPNAG